MEYLVIWDIDIDAETPEEAAREARAIQQDPASEATFFSVIDRDTGKEVLIDLLDPELDAGDLK